MYTRSTVLILKSRDDLQHIVDEFGRECEIMSLKVKTDKIKVLVVSKDQRANLGKVKKSVEEQEEDSKHEYFKEMITVAGV